MFVLQVPEVRDLEVFSRMPDRFRRIGVRSEWADANRGGQPTDSFLEGPVFDAAGNLTSPTFPLAASSASIRAAIGSSWPSGRASRTA